MESWGIAGKRELVAATEFTLFEVIIKPGMESTFSLGDLVAASTSIIGKDGRKIYFCVTLQPVALGTHLETSPEVLSFKEL